MSIPVTLSPRLRKLFDKGKLDEQFTAINEQAGLFLLGRHRQNMGDKQAALAKGFGPWRGRGNMRTKSYAPYVDWYAERKVEAGKRNWHVWDGHLRRDAIDNAKVHAYRTGLRITVAPGQSRPYAAVQQYGHAKNPRIPPRPYYAIDDSDMRKLSIFYQNRLTQAFGTEARWGHIK